MQLRCMGTMGQQRSLSVALLRRLRPFWSGSSDSRVGSGTVCRAALLALAGLDSRFKEFSSDAQANELAAIALRFLARLLDQRDRLTASTR
jgi:hypothetical protein